MMTQQPNIIFIITDQMRWDCLSGAGHPVVETPNLDELANRGVRFSAAYSACPSCIAARASFFTGLSPSTHGRLGYRDRVPWRYENLLPDLLARAGYQTHCVGKTHFYPQSARLGFQSVDSYQAQQNFDGTYVNDYFEWLRDKTNGTIREFDHGLDSNSWVARPSHLPEELHNNSWVAAKGIDFIRRRDKTCPFFLNLSFHRPHPPIDPPASFYDMYKDKELPDVPIGDWAGEFNRPVLRIDDAAGRLPKDQLDRARRAYYAQIGHIDNQIGRFFQAIKRTYPVGPTLVVFTSDHGEMLGDHDLFRKVCPYEGSAKVPLIMAWLNAPTDGVRVSDVPSVSHDIMPTLLHAAGLPVPEGVEGQNLLPILDEEGLPSGREFVHYEHSGDHRINGGHQTLTDGREKYIWYTASGKEQFFNLADDPYECRDLVNDPAAQDRLALWRQRMVAHLAQRPQDGLSDGTQLTPGTALPAVRPEIEE
jgi:arylsulfatase